MPQMQDAGRHAAVPAPHAGTHQAHQQIGIFPAPTGEGALKAIDGDKVRTPDAEIAALRAAPIAPAQLAQRPERQREERRKTLDLFGTPSPPPIGKAPAFRLEFYFQDSLRKRWRQQQPVAGHEPAALGQRAMRRDKTGSRDTIAVEEDAIIARCRQDRAVADFSEAETVIGMPDVVQAAIEPRPP